MHGNKKGSLLEAFSLMDSLNVFLQVQGVFEAAAVRTLSLISLQMPVDVALQRVTCFKRRRTVGTLVLPLLGVSVSHVFSQIKEPCESFPTD